MNLLRIKITNNGKPPTDKHPEDIGLDLYTRKVEDKGDTVRVFLGIAVEPSSGYYVELVPRSSIYLKYGLILGNSLGIIDPGFRGELTALFHKTALYDSNTDLNGTRLIQLILRPIVDYKIELTEELNMSIRGEKGYGSTGK